MALVDSKVEPTSPPGWVAAAKRLNAEKLEQRSKGVLSHQKDRIMQELNEKRALRLEQSRMLVAYGNVH